MVFLSRENIAMPDAKKGQMVYKWPDLQIRRFSNCIVEPDYVALFTLQGEVKGMVGPGRHGLEATELPFIGIFIDAATGGNRFRSELYYVSTRELLDKFGGPVDNVRDPISGIPCRLFVYGEYLVKVSDPQSLIFKYAGSQDVPDNNALTDLTDEFLKTALKVLVVQKVMQKEWEVFGISAYTAQIQQAVIAKANEDAAQYGLSITRLPSFNISLDDESQSKLDEFYRRKSLVTLAQTGGADYQRAAALEMQFGAAQGMAEGGGNTALLGVGLGMGQQLMGAAAPPPAAYPPPGYAAPPGGAAAAPAAATVACPSCGTQNPATAKFCASCGGSMAPPQAACPSCGTQNPASAKFCASCGAAMQAAPAPAVAAQTCAGCGAELAAGAKFCPSCGRATG